MTVTESTDTPIINLLEQMTAASIEASDLDPRTLMLVRFAALIALDAPPASYMMNLAVASEVGIDEQTARAVLLAVAPIVGTTRTVSAVGNIARALGLALELSELEQLSKT